MSPGKMCSILIVQYEIEVGKLCKTRGESKDTFQEGDHWK